MMELVVCYLTIKLVVGVLVIVTMLGLEAITALRREAERYRRWNDALKRAQDEDDDPPELDPDFFDRAILTRPSDDIIASVTKARHPPSR